MEEKITHKQYYRKPTIEEFVIVYQEEKKGYIIFMIKIFIYLCVLFVFSFHPVLKSVILSKDPLNYLFSNILLSLLPFLLVIFAIFGTPIYLVHMCFSMDKNLSAYKKGQYIVIPAVYAGHDRYGDGEGNYTLTFMYGDFHRYTLEKSSDRYYRNSQSCLIVKRFDNKKGYVGHVNPDVIKLS